MESSALQIDTDTMVEPQLELETASGEPNGSRTRIEGWLTTRIAAVLSTDKPMIAVDRPFADFGLDSALVISITLELGVWLGRELSVTLFWEYPTIEELAGHLAAE